LQKVCLLQQAICLRKRLLQSIRSKSVQWRRPLFQDKLVEKMTERIDVSKRQTLEVAEFKKIPGLKHNEVYEGKSLGKGKKH
jgi:hypothetical protein